MISAQWIYLGMALGLTRESLMDIRAMKPADSQYFLSMMFMQWLQHTVGYYTIDTYALQLQEHALFAVFVIILCLVYHQEIARVH